MLVIEFDLWFCRAGRSRLPICEQSHLEQKSEFFLLPDAELDYARD
jgi:hypothetical protein